MNKKLSLRESFGTLLTAVVLALITRSFIVTAYKVPSGSMQPTLKPGDFIFASRWSYSLRVPGLKPWVRKAPQRGDLVVFSYPQQPSVNYVKRVVAVGGDEVQISNDVLIVNGGEMKYKDVLDVSGENPNPESFRLHEEEDPHSAGAGSRRRVLLTSPPTKKKFGPLRVPMGEVFVLGDNRDASDDSRTWGTVPTDQIHAQVQIVWMSMDWQKKWFQDRFPHVRWERVFLKVD